MTQALGVEHHEGGTLQTKSSSTLLDSTDALIVAVTMNCQDRDLL